MNTLHAIGIGIWIFSILVTTLRKNFNKFRLKRSKNCLECVCRDVLLFKVISRGTYCADTTAGSCLMYYAIVYHCSSWQASSYHGSLQRFAQSPDLLDELGDLRWEQQRWSRSPINKIQFHFYFMPHIAIQI